MPSELKSETARANGAKSRGPTTAAGREKSSRNSLRHGFTSRSTIVLECENLEEFKEMLADYKATYQPANAAESDLVDQMVAARWRIRRIWTVETTLMDAEIRRNKPEIRKQYTHFSGADELAMAFRTLTDNSRALDLASRYESRLFRMHDRAYRTLRDLQQRRNEATNPLTPNPEVPIPPENKKSPNEPTHVVGRAPSPAFGPPVELFPVDGLPANDTAPGNAASTGRGDVQGRRPRNGLSLAP